MQPKNKSSFELIVALRNKGLRYNEIAQLTGRSAQYARTAYSRMKSMLKAAEAKFPADCCKFCGKPLIYTAGAKKKSFCNEQCHTKYYNKKRAAELNAGYCENCGKLFAYRGIYKKRFCSQECCTKHMEQNRWNQTIKK